MNHGSSLPKGIKQFYRYALLAVMSILALSSGSRATVTYTDLHDFTSAQGFYSSSSLLQGTDGNFYGSAQQGGTYAFNRQNGTIYKLTTAGVVTVLHTFTGAEDGSQPMYANLTEGPDGNYYGETYGGGTYYTFAPPANYGTIFKVTPSGTFTTLHYFNGLDGAAPIGGLVLGPDGNFYGVTAWSGQDDGDGTFPGNGAVFRISPTGTFTKLHELTGTDGMNPWDLTLGADGNFYGVTIGGQGTVFKVTTSGTFTSLHTFTTASGDTPWNLTLGNDGNLYGTTLGSNAKAFKITTSGTFTPLHTFTTAEGQAPYASLIQGMDGVLYGASVGGGVNQEGEAYSLTTTGTVVSLFPFAIGTGADPFAAMTQVASGNFFGVTAIGGAHSEGAAYRLVVPGVVPTTNPAPTVAQLSPSSIVAGSGNTVITVTGAHFVGGSVVKWKGTSLTTTFGSGTSLRAIVPAADLTTAGTASVTVFNPATGGGTSAGKTFTISTHTTPTTPGTPTNLTAFSEDGKLALSWDPSSGATSYNVYMTAGGTAAPVTGLVPPQYIYGGLTDGIYYTLTVAAVNSAGTSAQSTPVTARPESLNPPTNLVLTATGGVDQIDLSWTCQGADSYSIVRRESDPMGDISSPITIATVYPPQTTYVDADFPAGWSGTYYIVATNLVHDTDSNEDTATAFSGTATQFAVSAPSSAAAGTAFNFTVTAKDASGNTASGYTGTVHFSSTDGSATLPANATLTNGVGTFSATLATAGTHTITATDTVTSTITGTSDGITLAGSATHFTVAVPSTVTAGSQFGITVTALDAANNIATGYTGTVHFGTNNPRSTLPANSTLTSGVGTFNVTMTNAGGPSSNIKITATDTVASSITGTSSAITVNPAAATGYTVVAATTTPTAGVPFNVTVTAKDAYGNVAKTYAGTVHFTSNDVHATLPADSTLTTGTGTFSATLSSAGSRVIAATDTVNGSITGITNTLTVAAGPAAYFVVTAPGTVTAGSLFQFTVTARDTFGNVATGYAGTVDFSTNAPRSALPGSSTLTHGVGTFDASFTVAGTASSNFKITATDFANSLSGTSAAIAVNPDTVAGFSVAVPTVVIGGGPFNAVVTAQDAFGNTVTAYTGTVHFTSTDGQATLPANSTLSGGTGTFSVTMNTAGSQTLTATDTVSGSITGTSRPTTVDAATYLLIKAPANVTIGTTFNFTVTAVDQYNHVAGGYHGSIVFYSNATGATLPTTSTLTNGTGTFSATFGQAGTFKISAADTATGTPHGTSAGIVAGP